VGGQDGFLTVCLAHAVGTLWEQGEVWGMMDGQGRLAACTTRQDWRGAGGSYTAANLMVESKRLP